MLVPDGSPQRGRRRPCWLALAVTGLALVDGMVTTALAQGTPDSRVAVSLGGAFQVNETSFSQTVAFEMYSEEGSVTSTYNVGRAPVVDTGVIVRVWHNLGVGLAGSYLSDSSSAQVNALIPHPLEFNQLRPVSGPAEVSHTELDMHMEAAYWMQRGERLEVVVSGGPSLFRVDQDFVSDVTFSQAPPYDSATYQGATVVRERKTVAGGNIGGAVGWRLTRHLGVAATLRFSRATADFAGTSAQPITVGGFRVGGGVRLLF